MFFLIFWSDSETFNYTYIFVSETSPWRCQGYWPKHVGEDIYKINQIKVHLLVVDTYIRDSMQQKDPLLTVQFLLQKHCFCPYTVKGMFIWISFGRTLLMELRERKPSHINRSLTVWHPEQSNAAENVRKSFWMENMGEVLGMLLNSPSDVWSTPQALVHRKLMEALALQNVVYLARVRSLNLGPSFQRGDRKLETSAINMVYINIKWKEVWTRLASMYSLKLNKTASFQL